MEEEWELVDLTGPITAWAMPSESNILIYSIGSHVILWDLDSDNKFHIRCHESIISSILIQNSSQYFATIESSIDPFICIWSLNNFSQACVKFLPPKSRKQIPLLVDACADCDSLYVMEVEKEGGYRITRWNWTGNSLSYVDLFSLEIKEKATKIAFTVFPSFFTVEKNFVKIWELDERVHLSKKLYFKSEIKSAEYIRELSAFGIILGNYSFIIVDQSGVILTTFSQQYNCFYVYSEYVFLAGTSLQVYSLKSFNLISEVLETPIKIKSIILNGGNLACVVFENCSLSVIELENGMTMRTAAYHSTGVCNLKWDHSGNFYSIGYEGCVYSWVKQDIGWALEAFELSSRIVSALDLYENILCVGFDNGDIGIYNGNLENISMTNVYSETVADVKFTRTGTLIIGYKSGLVVILDPSYTNPVSVLQEEFKSPVSFCKISLSEIIESSENLILACTMKDIYTITVHRIAKKESCKVLAYKSLTFESKYQDFEIHTSGKYAIVSFEVCLTSIYDTQSGLIVGTIEASGKIALDPSGLYLSIISGMNILKLKVFEIGTGELIAEMGRIAEGNLINWSTDGKLISISDYYGKIEIWKVPEGIRLNIQKMLSRNEKNIWNKFPILYPNKGVNKKPPRIEYSDQRLSRSTFTEKVISFVPKKELKSGNSQIFDMDYKNYRSKNKNPEDPIEFKFKTSDSRKISNTVESLSFNLPDSRYARKDSIPKQIMPLDTPISLVSTKSKLKTELPIKTYDEPISFSKNLFENNLNYIKNKLYNPSKPITRPYPHNNSNPSDFEKNSD